MAKEAMVWYTFFNKSTALAWLMISHLHQRGRRL